MTNPYIRAAKAIPAIKEEATIKLDQRLQDAETIDGINVEPVHEDQNVLAQDELTEPEGEVEVQP